MTTPRNHLEWLPRWKPERRRWPSSLAWVGFCLLLITMVELQPLIEAIGRDVAAKVCK